MTYGDVAVIGDGGGNNNSGAVVGLDAGTEDASVGAAGFRAVTGILGIESNHGHGGFEGVTVGGGQVTGIGGGGASDGPGGCHTQRGGTGAVFGREKGVGHSLFFIECLFNYTDQVL
jgi:hypothetical protein